MISNTRCQHDWQENGNKIVCNKCNKNYLKKNKINDDLYYGIKSNGQEYTIRRDRNKYFYPEDWLKFMNSIREKHKLLFNFLICTGARIEEALHLKKTDLVDDTRKSIRLLVTKKKAKKPDEQEQGKPRSFEIKTSLYNELKKQKNLYIFLEVNNEMSFEESKKRARSKGCAYRGVLKRGLKRAGLNQNLYGLHNIRKTHGMWLKTLGIELSEVCDRLGHDENTFIKHYGSPSIFNGRDKEKMIKILGRIYNL